MKRFLLPFALIAFISIAGSPLLGYVGLWRSMLGYWSGIGMPLPFFTEGSAIQNPVTGEAYCNTEFYWHFLAVDVAVWSVLASGLKTWISRRKGDAFAVRVRSGPDIRWMMK